MTQLDTVTTADLSVLLEAERRGLQVHCYRFLGSLHDAEEATQETFLRAWRGRGGFRGEATLKTWLYRIATRVCLDLLKVRKRRVMPQLVGPAAAAAAAPAAPASEVTWLEPIPTEFVADAALDPASAYSLGESVRLAFIASLQTLPPQQRAVLILRDVLAWSASETAEALAITVSAANSALHRARRRLEQTYHEAGIDAMQDVKLDDPAISRLLDAYVRAWQDDDIEGLVSVVREDVRLAMPPVPTWYLGRADVIAFLRTYVMPQGALQLQATSANAQPAFVMSVRSPDDQVHPMGIMVLEVRDGLVWSIDCFMQPDVAQGFEAA